MIDLCAHVNLEEQDEDTIQVTRGIAVPFYGWDPELQADVPLIRCSICYATSRLPRAPAVRTTRVVAPNRKEKDGWELL